MLVGVHSLYWLDAALLLSGVLCGPRSISIDGSSVASHAGTGIHLSVLEPAPPGLLRRNLLGCDSDIAFGVACSCVTL